jgi:cytochrome P450
MTMPTAAPTDPAILQAAQALWTPAALQDPHPGYERLRSHGGVLDLPEWNALLLTSHAAVSAVLRSPLARSGTWLNGPQAPVSDATTLLRPMMLFHNGPSHARLRGLMAAAFTPRVIEEQRELVRGLLGELLRPGETDLVASLATPLPARVIMSMLGLSGDDEARFIGWSNSVAELLGGANQSPELLARIDADAREMREFFRGLADELRARPQPGLLSALARAEDGGERLSSDELLSNAVLLLAAGHETTSNLIGGGVLALQQQPGAWAAVIREAEEPYLPPAALADELLRHVSPVQMDGRVLAGDLSVAGAVLPAGRQVQVVLAAANRDPEVFPDPIRLDFSRPNVGRHLAFAAGPHYCLGASLAPRQ